MSAGDPETWVSLDAAVVAEGLAPAVVAALRERWEVTAPGPVRRRLTLRGGTLPAPPGGAPDSPAGPVGLAVSVRGNEVWLGEHLYLRVWEGGAAITVRGDGGAASEAAWTLALAEAHRAGGWLALHAALLGDGDGGRGVALSGPSGTGKSTAALRWAAAGGAVVAEDQVWIWPQAGRAVGADRWLRAHEAGVRRFAPGWLARAEGHDAHGKLRLPLPQPGREVTLTGLLVFGLPDPPSGPERVRALWEATGVPLSALGRARGGAGVAALLPRLPVRGVTREDVLERAQEVLTPMAPDLLESETPPESAGG
ncbi:hypothetical protein [Deinococcus murrayi]|uniref:hypothetical protein n=1 Tax=Deinococcus murrayi TaxID=68910 RepID=UPI0012F9450E|nr:hypothetical protein [Deinococcus murrayi]